MPRRFSVDVLVSGALRLDAAQSRHLRDVLRMSVGDDVELFDAAGRSAAAHVLALSPVVELEVGEVVLPRPRSTRLFIAAAIPKGNRADWMVEKLSELDVFALIPLESARTIVHPEAGKLQRFARLSAESAKQCRRRDVMRILEGQTSAALCARRGDYAAGWCLSTTGITVPVTRAAEQAGGDILAVIGPEGGWTDKELANFVHTDFQAVSLTQTILRIETAAIALASIVMSWANAKEQDT